MQKGAWRAFSFEMYRCLEERSRLKSLCARSVKSRGTKNVPRSHWLLRFDSTHQFVVNRYWWPSVVSDVYEYNTAVMVPNGWKNYKIQNDGGVSFNVALGHLSDRFCGAVRCWSDKGKISSRSSWTSDRMVNSPHYQVRYVGRGLAVFDKNVIFYLGPSITIILDNDTFLPQERFKRSWKKIK